MAFGYLCEGILFNLYCIDSHFCLVGDTPLVWLCRYGRDVNGLVVNYAHSFLCLQFLELPLLIEVIYALIVLKDN